MNIQPGFNESVLKALIRKIETMYDTDCNVTLAFDEMTRKQGLVYNEGSDTIKGFEDFGHIGQTRYMAKHAVVFMIWGLASKWKQQIGYLLSSGSMRFPVLQSLTWMCLDKRDKTGLKVVAFVFDLESNNRSFFQQLEHISLNKPYICHGSKNIFVIYDPPHLVKNIRNNFKKGDFVLPDNRIQWQHKVHFYNLDRSQQIQMALKLRDRHIELPLFFWQYM